MNMRTNNYSDFNYNSDNHIHMKLKERLYRHRSKKKKATKWSELREFRSISMRFSPELGYEQYGYRNVAIRKNVIVHTKVYNEETGIRGRKVNVIILDECTHLPDKEIPWIAKIVEDQLGNRYVANVTWKYTKKCTGKKTEND